MDILLLLFRSKPPQIAPHQLAENPDMDPKLVPKFSWIFSNNFWIGHVLFIIISIWPSPLLFFQTNSKPPSYWSSQLFYPVLPAIRTSNMTNNKMWQIKNVQKWSSSNAFTNIMTLQHWPALAFLQPLHPQKKNQKNQDLDCSIHMVHMVTSWNIFSLIYLTGPKFDKEQPLPMYAVYCCN